MPYPDTPEGRARRNQLARERARLFREKHPEIVRKRQLEYRSKSEVKRVLSERTKALRRANAEKYRAQAREAYRKKVATPEGRAEHREKSRAYRDKNPEKGKAAAKKYRAKPGIAERYRENKIKNREKNSAYCRVWRKENPKRFAGYVCVAAKRSKKSRDELSDPYIKSLLRGEAVVTPELIEIKRLQVKIHRLIGEKL